MNESWMNESRMRMLCFTPNLGHWNVNQVVDSHCCWQLILRSKKKLHVCHAIQCLFIVDCVSEQKSVISSCLVDDMNKAV